MNMPFPPDLTLEVVRTLGSRHGLTLPTIHSMTAACYQLPVDREVDLAVVMIALMTATIVDPATLDPVLVMVASLGTLVRFASRSVSMVAHAMMSAVTASVLPDGVESFVKSLCALCPVPVALSVSCLTLALAPMTDQQQWATHARLVAVALGTVVSILLVSRWKRNVLAMVDSTVSPARLLVDLSTATAMEIAMAMT